MVIQRNRRSNTAIGILAVAAASALVALTFVLLTRPETVATRGAKPVPGSAIPPDASDAPTNAYTLDLGTGETTPLRDEIQVSVADFGRDPGARYAVSRDGSMLAYVGFGDDANPQIFVAATYGMGLHQVTHDVREAMSPAWSPDGQKLVYVGYGATWDGNARRLFVVDLTTGVSTRITGATGEIWSPQFTPDGSSIIYTSDVANAPILKIVPVWGGRSKVFLAPNRGLEDTGNGSLSPDGKRVTFLASGFPDERPSGFHCGPCRFLANADGTQRRVLGGGCWASNPAGTWSADGRRIVCSNDINSIVVVDVESGRATRVAEGKSAIWLDRQTLLIDVA